MLWWQMEKPDTLGSRFARTRWNQRLVWGWIWGSQSRKKNLKLIPEIIWEVLQYLVDVQNLVRLCKCKEMRKIRKIVAIILSISITFPPLFSTTCPPSPHFWRKNNQNMDLNLAQRSAKSFLVPLSYSDKFEIFSSNSNSLDQLCSSPSAPPPSQSRGEASEGDSVQCFSPSTHIRKKSLPPSPWQTLLCPSSPERG